VLLAHFNAKLHVEHGPPQSMSDSPWFWIPSAQLGVWQILFVQTPLVQSAGAKQPSFGGQSPQPVTALFPQSCPVSPPLSLPSMHVGTLQIPPLQTWLRQSPLAPHIFPSMHAPQLGPPQSWSLSVPFFTPSPHAAGTHMWDWQTWPGQSATCVALLHATHVPGAAASPHFFPPFSEQAIPAATATWTGMPAAQVSVVQLSASSGTSVSFGTVVTAPFPSHSCFRQSFGWPTEMSVCAATFIAPQPPALQVALTQAFAGGGQSVAETHSTHFPFPSQ
jgi:hypothetical protein